METKDIIYSSVITLTLIISVISLLVNIKNRRNALREHLYKEQVSFFLRLFVSFNKLNTEIDSLYNNKDRRHNNQYHEIIQSLGLELYNNDVLIPNDITEEIKNLIVSSHDFYMSILSMNSESVDKNYDRYFSNYFKTLSYIKDFVGTNNLSSENKALHTHSRNNSARLVKEIILKITESTILK